MNAIIAFAASPLSVLKRTPRRDGLDRSCSILGDNLLLSDTYGNDEKLQTFGGCGSNSVCMVWCRKRAGCNEHHHRRRTAIQVVRTRERHLQIPRNSLGGVRCGSAHLAVGYVDGPRYLQQRRRMLCRRGIADRSRIRLRQIMLDESGFR